LTFIKESDTATSIRVAVTQQKRKKALQAEPWGEPKVNADESSKIADELKPALTAS